MTSPTPLKSNQIMYVDVNYRGPQRYAGACMVFRGHPFLRIARADGWCYSKAQKNPLKFLAGAKAISVLLMNLCALTQNKF